MTGIISLREWAWVHKEHVPQALLAAFRRACTVPPRKGFRGVDIPEIRFFVETDTQIGLPYAYALDKLPEHLLVRERRSVGYQAFDCWTRRPDPEHPQAPAGQRAFMAQTRHVVREQVAALVEAETGTGKTVVALDALAALGRQALVIVPTTVLRDQWIEEAHLHLGVPYDKIGLIQGKKRQYDKPLSVAVMKTIALQDFPPAVRGAFGAVVYDEVHRAGAPLMSQALGVFHARYQVGLTATVARRDGTDRLYRMFFGDVATSARLETVPIDVHVHDWYSAVPSWVTDPALSVGVLARDTERNAHLCRLIADAHERGREVLAVGDSIDHIESIRALLSSNYGVDPNKVGQFTATHTGEDGARHATSRDYLSWCLKHAKVILATYGMFKEGTSVARLDWGIELTPSPSATQLMGRVRRRLEGKPKAEWHTIRDNNFPWYLGYFMSRMRDYRKDSKVTVHSDGAG